MEIFCAMLDIKPRVLHMLGRGTPTELHPQTHSVQEICDCSISFLAMQLLFVILPCKCLVKYLFYLISISFVEKVFNTEKCRE
jgi:hypothetical protein